MATQHTHLTDTVTFVLLETANSQSLLKKEEIISNCLRGGHHAQPLGRLLTMPCHAKWFWYWYWYWYRYGIGIGIGIGIDISICIGMGCESSISDIAHHQNE